MASNYPLTGFHFKVNWIKDNDENINFSEDSGLSVSTTAIEYRDGANPDYRTYKMPGLRKYNNVTLKRGSVSIDSGFYDWFNSINNNTVERRDVVISLLNEEHKPVITWNLKDAFPVKYDGGSLNASQGQVLVESVELAYESFKVDWPTKESKKDSEESKE